MVISKMAKNARNVIHHVLHVSAKTCIDVIHARKAITWIQSTPFQFHMEVNVPNVPRELNIVQNARVNALMMT